MKRIYKNTDLNFPISLLPATTGETMVVKFFTRSDTQFIRKTKDDIVDGHITLTWSELSALDEGILNIWTLVSTHDSNLDDNSYDVAEVQNTPFYIVIGKKDGQESIEDMILNNYYSKEEIDEKFENIDVNIGDIDLTGYAKKATLTQAEYDALEYKDPDTIYIITDAEADYYTKEEIDDKLSNIDVSGGDVDLSNYYTKDEIYNKNEVDEALQNVSVDLTGYATEQWVNEQGYLTSIPENYVTESELGDSLNNKADKSEIPSLSGYATEEWITEQDYTRQTLLTKAEYDAITPEENVMYIITDVEDEWVGTQAEYDALPTKNPDTTYFIIEG